MKTIKKCLPAIALIFIVLGTWTSAVAQFTPSQDAYTDSSKPTTNFGTAITLDVANTAAAIQTAYIQFDLSSIPAGFGSANIGKATLKIYVNTVTTGGSFNIDFVNGSWSEKTITANITPALGTTIASSVPLVSGNTKDYVLVDITSAVQAWLSGAQVNDGIALVANSPLSSTLDSKENGAQSHPAELDIVFNGAITDVNTASGSGLTGGGASGALNLSLLKTCSSTQVLQWNGSSWACGSVGTGTVTGVTAGTDLTGGGAGGNVTLNLDTTKVPQLSSANTFTSSQIFNASIQGQTASFSGSNNGSIVQVTQNSSTTGAALAGVAGGNSGVGLQGSGVTGVVGTGLAPPSSVGVEGTGNFTGVLGVTNSTTSTSSGVVGQANASSGAATGVTGESTSGTGVFGGSNATTGVTYGVQGINHNSTQNAAGVEGENFATSGVTFGLVGASSSPHGIGAVALGVGESSIGFSLIGCCPVGVWGDTSSNAGGAAGLVGTADDARAIYLQNNSPSGVPTAFMFQSASGKLALVAGGSVGACTVDTSGNLACHGSKSAVVPVDDGQRQVALYAEESPQNWFEDFGSGHLGGGTASIALEPIFAQTVDTASDYHVFLTPEGDCRGLYVTNKSARGFEVHELGGGQSNVAFAYRIVALRRGYESVRLADLTEAMSKARALPTPLSTPGNRVAPATPSALHSTRTASTALKLMSVGTDK